MIWLGEVVQKLIELRGRASSKLAAGGREFRSMDRNANAKRSIQSRRRPSPLASHVLARCLRRLVCARDVLTPPRASHGSRPHPARRKFLAHGHVLLPAISLSTCASAILSSYLASAISSLTLISSNKSSFSKSQRLRARVASPASRLMASEVE